MDWPKNIQILIYQSDPNKLFKSNSGPPNFSGSLLGPAVPLPGVEPRKPNSIPKPMGHVGLQIRKIRGSTKKWFSPSIPSPNDPMVASNFMLLEKAMFQMGKVYLLRSPHQIAKVFLRTYATKSDHTTPKPPNEHVA